jgi:regulator of sigma E protease
VETVALVALAIAAISTVIVFHEFGHFVVARCLRVRVEQFSFGLGREILGFTDRCGTRWSVGVVPLAGIVRFYGPTALGRAGIAASERRSTPYDKARPGARLIIVLGGPLFSLILAFFATALIFYCFSEHIEPIVGNIAAGSAAERAGLAPGDRILAIDGSQVVGFEDLRESIQNSHAPIRRLSVLRSGQVIAIDVAPTNRTLSDGCKIAVVGFSSSNQMVRYSSIESVTLAANLLNSVLFRTISAWTLSQDTTCAPGVRLPTSTIAPASNGAVEPIMMTMGMFSFSYAIFNFIPMRTLDGSELIFCLLALIRGRSLRQRTEERVGRVMFTSATLLFSVLGVIYALR